MMGTNRCSAVWHLPEKAGLGSWDAHGRCCAAELPNYGEPWNCGSCPSLTWILVLVPSVPYFCLISRLCFRRCFFTIILRRYKMFRHDFKVDKSVRILAKKPLQPGSDQFFWQSTIKCQCTCSDFYAPNSDKSYVWSLETLSNMPLTGLKICTKYRKRKWISSWSICCQILFSPKMPITKDLKGVCIQLQLIEKAAKLDFLEDRAYSTDALEIWILNCQV